MDDVVPNTAAAFELTAAAILMTTRLTCPKGVCHPKYVMWICGFTQPDGTRLSVEDAVAARLRELVTANGHKYTCLKPCVGGDCESKDCYPVDTVAALLEGGVGDRTCVRCHQAVLWLRDVALQLVADNADGELVDAGDAADAARVGARHELDVGRFAVTLRGSIHPGLAPADAYPVALLVDLARHAATCMVDSPHV